MYKSVEDLLEVIKNGSLNVSKLSRETGIPAARMYKWRDRGSEITAKDSAVLQEWIEKMDKSPKQDRSDKHSSVPSTETKEDLLPVLIQLMKTQNRILERQETEVVDRVKNIEASLDQLAPVLAGVSSVSLQLDSARQTVLRSLSRLEGKSEDSLLEEADRILANKMSKLKPQGKHSRTGK